MWLRIALPDFGASGALVRLARVYASEGSLLNPGDSLLDLIVDLSAGVVRDCPPVSTCRIILREPVWLRTICVSPDEVIAHDADLALVSFDPESPPQVPARDARVTAATMLHQEDWWTFGA